MSQSWLGKPHRARLFHRHGLSTLLLVVTMGAAGAGFVSSPSAGAASVAIPSPTAGGWQLNGSAALKSTASPPNLQLTAATANQAGSAFWPTPVPGVGISAAFDASIGSGTGADGLTFTLADASANAATALGVGGGGLGFSGIKGIAVSLDTYKNAVNPSSNFVGIATGAGTTPDTLNYVTTNSSIASLRGTVHHFVVTTTSTGLTVTMDGSQVLSFATTLPANVLVGFTGGTGGLTDIHAVQNVSITATTSPPAAPTVTLVNPVGGPSGTSVTVTGTNFTGATAVSFGTTPATNFTVNNATTITAVAPAGTGTVDVTVAAPGGTSAINPLDEFTYSAGTSPATIPSPTAGGWQLNGSAALKSTASPPNLQLTAATANQAGSAFWPTPVPSVGISAAFDASIGSGTGADGLTFTLADASATAPTALGAAGGGLGFSGIKGIAVSLDTYKNAVNPSSNFVGIATGAGTTPDTLNYVTTNSSIASLRGTVHHFVVTTFSGGLSVTMDGSQVLAYSTTLPANVLVGFTGGTGGLTDIHAVQNVSITAGTPPPAATVSGVSPTSGPAAGGTSVIISGSNFTGASEVDFGSNPAPSFTVNSAGSIAATSPFGTGTVDVTIITPGGTSTTNVNDEFTYTGSTPRPTVTGLNPSGGAAAGGTSVMITGTSLTGASAVTFGTTPATNFTVNNPTTITATSPAGSGTVDVTVTTPGGASLTNVNDEFTYAGSSSVAIPSPTAGGWQLNGSAALESSASPPNLQLTAATANEAGSAFWPTPLPGVGISAAFDASIGSGTGADGLTFTLADASATAPTAVGAAGGGLGFGGIKGIAVSMDTFKNAVNPSNNFVGIATGAGTAPGTLNYVTTNSSIASLRGTVHHFVVTTSATGLTVTMDGSQVLSFATTLPADVLVGFTGGTGGLTDVHAVQNVAITAGAPPPAPAVSGLNPTSGAAAGGTSVTITGSNLTGATAVNFGTTPATSFTVNNPTTVTAVAPADIGNVDVTVTTAGGASAANANDQFTYAGSPSAIVTYRGDIARDGYYASETGLTTANVTSLKPAWTDNGGVNSFAQPVVADNMVFWSDWTGLEHATNLSGKDVWTTNLGTTTPPASDDCAPTEAGPTSTPTIVNEGGTFVMYVGGGNGVMYKLNAQTGAIIWQTRLGPSPDNFLWDSPTLYDGTVYMGVASYGDCPLVQGELVAMNAETGKITHIADMVPNGCIGGGIWSSPTVDTSAGTIWVSTGTPHSCGTGPTMAPAIVSIRASDLTVLGFWNVPVASQAAGDADFGATPTLFTATINGQVRSLVGAVNKDAIFYAWDRNNPSAGPVWQSTIATASGSPIIGSIVSASWDGTTLYVGGGQTTINGASCMGSIDALNPSTGAFIWRNCQPFPMFSGLTVVPGIIVQGNLGGTVTFTSTATGATLFTYNTGVSEVQGECAVSNGVVYIPLDDGQLVALDP
jgi:hypothetical protein